MASQCMNVKAAERLPSSGSIHSCTMVPRLDVTVRFGEKYAAFRAWGSRLQIHPHQFGANEDSQKNRTAPQQRDRGTCILKCRG